MVASRIPLLSEAEYLELEKTAPVRHEYIDGEIVAMSGSSDDHATIVGNVFVALSPIARGRGCRIFPQDVKAKIKEQSRYFYPDMLVTCDPRDREDKYVKQHYKLIVEVLSPSTEAFDRGKKFEDYRRSDTLEEYVLVAQDRIAVDIFRRNDAGRWELQGYGPGEEVEIVSLGGKFAISALYEDVEILPETNLQEPMN